MQVDLVRQGRLNFSNRETVIECLAVAVSHRDQQRRSAGIRQQAWSSTIRLRANPRPMFNSSFWILPANQFASSLERFNGPQVHLIRARQLPNLMKEVSAVVARRPL